MEYLTENNIDFITKEITESGITSDELKQDLIDHFCCVIEEELNKGKSFNEAYDIAYKNICPNGFEDIQKETVYLLTKKKTEIMKKSLFLAGILILMGTSTGLLFKTMHWPGANMIWLVSSLALIFWFFPSLFIFLYKREVNKVFSNKLKHILGWLGFSFLFLAILLKWLHWPGANILLGLSVLVLNLGYFPLILFKMYRKERA
jgi:hypothetical protein